MIKKLRRTKIEPKPVPVPEPVVQKQRLSVVTGGAGFIGSNLVDMLLERGDRVVVIDNESANTHDEVYWNPNAMNISGDVTDFKLLKNDLVSYSVPTGNFGDILAGWVAKQMGLPIKNLMIATNENDILSRALKTGIYSIDKAKATISPSMDIQISSNFERLLFEAYNRDFLSVNNLMDNLKNSKEFKIEKNALNFVRNDFLATSITEQETKECISDIYKKTGYILDPHTAVGYAASRSLDDKNGVVVTLGTCIIYTSPSPRDRG